VESEDCRPLVEATLLPHVHVAVLATCHLSRADASALPCYRLATSLCCDYYVYIALRPFTDDQACIKLTTTYTGVARWPNY